MQMMDTDLAQRLRAGEIARVDLIDRIVADEVDRNGLDDMGIDTLEIARRIDEALNLARDT
ncbi:hypothetical protein [Mycobacteroides abscessus]|jgi:hypothetical protein|uniref:hypothetical protein n=1 Tax=Mycobacteroides abscessus TaxID=36809 RepID=UPI00094207BE|nr:hypothetical protein [Mycobacteroides abscessus]